MESTALKVECPECAGIVNYAESHCECGAFVGFPNYRRAQAEERDLDKRYQTEVKLLEGKGLADKQSFVERLAEESFPVTSMGCNVLHDMLKGKKYENYHIRLAHGSRKIADEQDHKDRLMVEVQLFAGYEGKIIYAALSCNNSILTSYGNVSVTWNVAQYCLERRITVHEENSFDFYEHHNLGALRTKLPLGYLSLMVRAKKNCCGQACK